MMRATRIVLAVLAVLAVTGSAAAQVASSFALVPVISKGGGARDTEWLTDLSISNLSGFAVDVEARFFEENRNNIALLVPVERFGLEVGQTLTVRDVMTTWYPGKGDTKGFLLITAEPADGSEEQAVVAVTARVFNNADPNATYGQAVSPGLYHVGMGAVRSVLVGAQWDEIKRSNVGVVNLSLDPIDVIITVYDADGAVISSRIHQVKTLSLIQRSLQNLGVTELSTPGRVEVRLDPSSITWDPCDIDLEELDLGSLHGLFIAYMSRADQVTGDAEFILGSNDWREFVAECGEIPLPGF